MGYRNSEVPLYMYNILCGSILRNIYKCDDRVYTVPYAVQVTVVPCQLHRFDHYNVTYFLRKSLSMVHFAQLRTVQNPTVSTFNKI